MKRTLYTTSNQAIILDQKLGSGGEGEVWNVVGSLKEVAKIYHPNKLTLDKRLKLEAMISNPPKDQMRHAPYNHISIAWPTDLLYERNNFVGYLMPRIPKSPTILEVYNPRLRMKRFPDFNWKYLHRIARNLAVSVEAIHTRGYVIGDLNESNIFVSDRALISLVDTDSFQVTDQVGHIFRCPVGKPEYTSPELQGVDFKTVIRTVEQDYFSLAVIIFLLLMNGTHPFSGVLSNTHLSVGRVELFCIKNGIFPFDPKNAKVRPGPNAPNFQILSPTLQSLFMLCFVKGHNAPNLRPTSQMWQKALERTEKSLVECRKDQTHYYAKHLKRCPWCKPAKTSIPKQIRPKPSSQQKPMPPASTFFPKQRSRKIAMSHLTPQPMPKTSLKGVRRQTNIRALVVAPLTRTVSHLGFLRNIVKIQLSFWKTWLTTIIPAGIVGIFCGIALSLGVFVLFIDPEITSGLVGLSAGFLIIFLFDAFARAIGSARGFPFIVGSIIAYRAGSFIVFLILILLQCHRYSLEGMMFVFSGLGMFGGVAVGNFVVMKRLDQSKFKALTISVSIIGLAVVGLVMTNTFYLAFQPTRCYVGRVGFEFWVQFFRQIL